MRNGNTLQDTIGNLDIDNNDNITEQLASLHNTTNQLNNNKLNKSDVNNYISPTITNWLNNNVNPVGSAVTIDKSLSIEGSAADAKIIGDKLKKLLDCGTPTIGNTNITQYITDGKLSTIEPNKYVVFGPSGSNLLTDIPNRFKGKAFSAYTLNNNSNVAFQFLFSGTGPRLSYYRVIFNYKQQNEDIYTWDSFENNESVRNNEIISTIYPVVNNNNISSILSNNKASDAPYNSVLTLSSSSSALVTDIPNICKNYTIYLVTIGKQNSGNVIQLLWDGHGNTFYRIVYNYGTNNIDASEWLNYLCEEYFLYCNTITIGNTNINEYITDGKLSTITPNKYFVFGPSGSNLIVDIPNEAIGKVLVTYTFVNESNVAIQFIFSGSTATKFTYYRIIFGYNTQTEDITPWLGFENTEAINTNFATLGANNVSTILPNLSTLEAPCNSILTFSAGGSNILVDIPSYVKNTTMYLMTAGKENSYNTLQIIWNSDGEVLQRVCYNYGLSSVSASPWTNPSHSYRNKKWCFFGDSLCYRDISGFGFPNVLDIHNYVNNGTAQATLHYNNNSIPKQVETQIADTTASFDYIVIEGGWNDWYSSIPTGNIPTSITTDASNIDKTNACGGLEFSIVSLINRYPTAKLYYLAVHKIGAGTEIVGNNGENFTQMVEKFKAICRLYGVEIIDCFNDSGLNTVFNAMKTNTTDNDGIHPTLAGFRKFYKPVILKHINNC